MNGLIRHSFMIQGFENDDQWRMVEDEFYAVAGQFTAHLHAAEYHRLREEAKNQDPNSMQAISRPVTAPPTSYVKQRQAALALATAQRRGVRTAMSRINGEDTEDEDDEIPLKGTHLAGLMNSPRKKIQPLASMTSTAGGSRAAALGSLGTDHGSPSTSKVAFVKHHKVLFPARTKTDHRVSEHDGRWEASRSRTTSQPAQTLDESDDDDDLERYSSTQRPTHRGFSTRQPVTARDETSQSSQTRSASSHTAVASRSREMPVAKSLEIFEASSTAAAPATTEQDSDSSSETYFQRRIRERRSQRKSSRRKSSTPGEPSGKDESQPSQQKSQISQKSQSAVLAIPSI